MTRLAAGLLPILLTAAVGAARQQYVHAWKWVAPEEEEFGVLFPEVNFRIRRELVFGAGRVLRPVSYEVTNRGVTFSVLSFAKSEANGPKSLDDFIAGMGRALAANEFRARSSYAFAREVTLEGRRGREFAVKVGDLQGTARVYEGGEHFYLVLGIGLPSGAAAVEHFQESFSFNRGGPSRVSARVPAEALSRPIPAPAPLWPVASYSKSPFGVVIGNRDAGSPAATEAAGRERQVLGGIMTGKALKKVAPEYPPIAKAARAQGPVVVQIIVDEEGYVIAADAVSGHPLLQQAAAVAVRQWRFSPTLLEGRPVKVTGTVTVNFTLV